jgi:uncharacterized protein
MIAVDSLAPSAVGDSEGLMADNHETVNCTLAIDSYHIFQYRGDYMLFDIGMGVVCEINEFTFALLAALKNSTGNIDQALDKLDQQGFSCEKEVCVKVLEELKHNGFFQPLKTWIEVGDNMFEPYWDHNPRRLQLMTAESCNLKCGYCYAWRNDMMDKRTLMSWSVAKSAVDDLVWRSGRRRDIQITFFGGEPLLNYKVIQQTVDYCQKLEKHGDKKLLFELITNGTLLTKDVTDYIAENNFILFVSLDGWREMHNINRPCLDNVDRFDTILENAIYADNVFNEKKLPKVKVRANLTPDFRDIKKVTDYLESQGFTYIGIGPIEPLPHSDRCGMCLTESQLDELAEEQTDMMLNALDRIKKREDVGPYIGRNIRKSLKSMKLHTFPGIICGVCRNTAIVDNKGFLYPCHRYAGMDKYRIGDIFHGTDKTLVYDYYRKISERAVRDCQKCWIRDYCAGGCPWYLSDKNGMIHTPSEENCNRRRRMTERSLWMRKELLACRPDIFDQEVPNAVASWQWKPEDACH